MDDLLIVSRNEKANQRIVDELSQLFECKNMGAVSFLLGTKITQCLPAKKLHMDQHALIEKTKSQFEYLVSSRAKSPMPANTKLAESRRLATALEVKKFQKIVGALLYLSRITRPDIAFSVKMCSRFTKNLSDEHFRALENVQGYLRQTWQLKLSFV